MKKKSISHDVAEAFLRAREQRSRHKGAEVLNLSTYMQSWDLARVVFMTMVDTDRDNTHPAGQGRARAVRVT